MAIEFPNPKQASRDRQVYPYYAGYSERFVHDALVSLGLSAKHRLLDPWNGTGTTTAAAAKLGIPAVGVDLNPSLLVVANARLLPLNVVRSVEPLCDEILIQAAQAGADSRAEEPLLAWFNPATAAVLRQIERTICQLLVEHSERSTPAGLPEPARFSTLASFFYLALFRTARHFVSPFRSSNPAWIRVVRAPAERIAVQERVLLHFFRSTVKDLLEALTTRGPRSDAESDSIELIHGDCRRLPLPSGSITTALTSPPYCTRIDYAVTTRPELAVLGFPSEAQVALRDTLMGTPTVRENPLATAYSWLPQCRALLSAVRNHPSRASATYYHTFYVQYFSDLYESFIELDRVMARGSTCIFVLQDSRYKDVRVDLAGITVELAGSLGWEVVSRQDFRLGNPLSAINSKSRRYTGSTAVTETVVHLRVS